MPEEQHIHTDDNGDQRHNVKRDKELKHALRSGAPLWGAHTLDAVHRRRECGDEYLSLKGRAVSAEQMCRALRRPRALRAAFAYRSLRR